MQKLIKSIEKNAKEDIRLELCEFKGHNLLNLRIFFKAHDGIFPTKKGITLNLSLIPEILEGLQEARLEAEKAGLLPSDQREKRR